MESTITKLANKIRKISTQQFVGVVMIALFTLILLLVLGIVPSRQIEEDPPPWVVIPVFGMFLCVGVFLVTQYTRFERYTGLIMAASIIIGMVLVLNWGAFGPGYRECSRSISLPFLSLGSEASDTECRVVIGYFALLLDAVLVIALASRAAVTFGDHSWTRILLYAAYGLLLLLLLPLVLPVVIGMFFTGGSDKLKTWFQRRL